MDPAETRRIVEGYFHAWTTQRVGEAREWLADDLEFAGPSASYRTAEEFLPALTGFAKITRAARIVEVIVDGDRAAMLYDCDFVPPAGTVRIASFFRVAGGKITRYDTRFDVTELRKLQAK